MLPYLPETARRAVGLYVSRRGAPVPEEVRLRVARPLQVVASGRDIALDPDGNAVRDGGVRVEPADLTRAMELVSGSSVYALEDQIRLGFITIPGGHRVGLCGTAVTEGAAVRTFRDISGVNYRFAREARGAGARLIPALMGDDGRALNTIVISPPGCGKTTLLRDLVRCLSDGEEGAKPSRVCLVDERSEVAACSGGIPRNYVGQRTDVLDSCPKAHGIMTGIRSLSPEVIATDEIGRAEDSAAIAEALVAGVSVVATAHARDVSDAARRPGIGEILREGYFERAVVLSGRFGPGTVEGVFDLQLRGVFRDVREGRRASDAGVRILGGGVHDRFELLLPREGAR
ncbi:MAG: stage III sporulation protein AA [Ignavibacteriales bacterium]